MMKAKKILLFLFIALPFFLKAQTTTRTTGSTATTPAKKTKILIVPWEPRMFNANSDVTHAISNETGQKYNQIQEAFRKGILDELKHSFGATCSVVSLLDDTAKMKDDLQYAYACSKVTMTPVTFPLNPTKQDSVKLKQQSGIQNGQVAAAADETDKFMNVNILSPNLLAYFKKKYNADYIVFLNECDFDNDLGADPYNLQGKSDFPRIATVHWTIFSTTTNLRIAAGKNNTTFSSTVNSPKKIITEAFSVITNAMYAKYNAAPKP